METWYLMKGMKGMKVPLSEGNEAASLNEVVKFASWSDFSLLVLHFSLKLSSVQKLIFKSPMLGFQCNAFAIHALCVPDYLCF